MSPRLPSYALLSLIALAPPSAPSDSPPFVFDHAWFAVAPGATLERAALERAGLRFASGVNRHEGQGTASITVEFRNAYLELVWIDSTVSIPAERRGYIERQQRRVNWRTTGTAPMGIELHRAPGTPDSLPFPTWSTRAPWMPPGAAFEIITPRTDSVSPSFTILPRMMAVEEVSPEHPGEAPRSSALQQPLGLQRVTDVRLTIPRAASDSDALHVFQSSGAAQVVAGDTWCLALTFDDGVQHKTLDLRATLPLILHY